MTAWHTMVHYHFLCEGSDSKGVIVRDGGGGVGGGDVDSLTTY